MFDKTYQVKPGETAWAAHNRELALRALKIEDAKYEAIERYEAHEDELRRATRVTRARSPFQDLVDEARAARRGKPGILSWLKWW